MTAQRIVDRLLEADEEEISPEDVIYDVSAAGRLSTVGPEERWQILCRLSLADLHAVQDKSIADFNRARKAYHDHKRRDLPYELHVAQMLHKDMVAAGRLLDAIANVLDKRTNDPGWCNYYGVEFLGQ